MRARTVLVTVAVALAILAGLCAASLLRRPVLGPITAAADRILVEKAAHRLTLLKNGRVISVYRVALGRGGPGAKTVAGDGKVPEGVYRIAGRNPASAYHLSLRIGYPTTAQIDDARRRGVDPGGDIMIHGIRNGLGWIGGIHRQADWTQGCVAVTDAEIEEIWRLVPDGTEVEIRG